MCTPQFSVYSVHDVLRSLEAVLYLISVKHLRETCARILSKFLLSNFDTSSRKFLFRLSRFAFYLVHGTCTRKKTRTESMSQTCKFLYQASCFLRVSFTSFFVRVSGVRHWTLFIIHLRWWKPKLVTFGFTSMRACGHYMAITICNDLLSAGLLLSHVATSRNICGKGIFGGEGKYNIFWGRTDLGAYWIFFGDKTNLGAGSCSSCPQ